MTSDQRKAVVVVPYPLKDDVPPLYGVALLAVGSHLAAMNVGMAIGAVCSSVREDRLGVALGASHPFMQAAQRIPCFVVIELRNRSNGLPSRRGVTVLAGNVQVAVGAARHRRTAGLSESERPASRQHQAHCSHDDASSRE